MNGHRPIVALLLAALGSALLGAAGPEDWLRQGNAAFLRGDYLAALACYERAEPDALDPGLVAFNQAAALSRLGRFAEAEDFYRRSLEDATGPRRVQALYGLGNALAEQGRRLPVSSAAAEKLTEAVASFGRCLELSPYEADARHNLALAQRWLVNVKTELAARPPPSDGSGANPPEPGSAGIARKTGGAANDDGTEPGGPDSDMTNDPNAKPGNGKKPGRYRPGRGNLPALLDDKNAPPLTPELAQQYLEEALDRIARERATRPPLDKVPGRVRDY